MLNVFSKERSFERKYVFYNKIDHVLFINFNPNHLCNQRKLWRALYSNKLHRKYSVETRERETSQMERARSQQLEMNKMNRKESIQLYHARSKKKNKKKQNELSSQILSQEKYFKYFSLHTYTI